MLKTIIKLVVSDDLETQIAPDVSAGIGVQSATVTQCVNNGEELTLGSACASALEVTLIAPNGCLALNAGTVVAAYKEDDAGNQTRIGIFTLEKPTYPTANTMRLVGYDNVSRLDKDMTAWLAHENDGSWTLLEFARRVCSYCGLLLVNTELAPNGAFFVPKFSCGSVTGRQLMQWIGEICCRFCRADADGNIEFGWYQPSSKEISASGARYYFKNGLTYENYATAKIDVVLVGASNSEVAVYSEGLNCYTISGNPILNAMQEDTVDAIVDEIQKELEEFSYVPCKVSIPADLDIHPGEMLTVVDKNGKRITTCVMTKIQTGQTDTLESTGSYRRDSTVAVNNQTAQQKTAQMESRADLTLVNATNYANKVLEDAKAYASAKINEAKDLINRSYIVDALTENGALQGIYSENGQWHIDAERVRLLNLLVEHLSSVMHETVMEITNAALRLACNDLEILRVDSQEGRPTVQLQEYTADVLSGSSALTARQISFGEPTEAKALSIGLDTKSGDPFLTIVINDEEITKKLKWKSNDDGTYSLIGE